MAKRHTQVTRRPQQKKTLGKVTRANNRRRARRAAREHTRKMARKLSRMATKIDDGLYSQIKESPLLHLNWSYVIQRSMVAKHYWTESKKSS